ncbi:hypothetical protein WJX73_005635 [Symbiochloris irregularis]|uniref:proline--tRNA ligase n=1 Tax=Symbiochloris irregularis TaxID=706552 RepID=A0AAW1NZE3_9CHLO
MASDPLGASDKAQSSTAKPQNGSSSNKSAKPAKEKKPKQKAEGQQAAGDTRKKEMKKETKEGLSASKASSFADWYTQVVTEAELIAYYKVSGCYILRPGAYFVWETIQRWFDGKIRESGVQNAYFPMFVTEEQLNAEKNHVEGFAAEVAWVTKSGSSDLDRPIAIRPTSETVMYPYYAQWVRSHRDLPLRLNQWNTVVRWEFSNPTPFIRSREFLWQEGHSAFATQAEAEGEVFEILDLYARVYTDLMAVPVIKGRKSEGEKFAGALFTTTVEAFVPATGRGIQGGTSHCLGQNFSKMFGIDFEAEDRSKQLVWQNSWGLSTRTIGVMIMVHGDDKGLVMPPRCAQTQVVIIPIPNAKLSVEAKQAMAEQADKFAGELRALGLRVALDSRDNYTPGWKYSYWELRGVPIRLELGPKDMEKESCVLARRDTLKKEPVAWSQVASEVPKLLDTIQHAMYEKALAERDAGIEKVTTWEDFVRALDRKHLVLAPWAYEEEIEKDVKKRSATAEAMGAKTLCIPLEQPDLPSGTKCFASGREAKNWALWGRSY